MSNAYMQKESDGVRRAQVNADLSVGGSKVSATNKLPVEATLEVGDIEIGAVEIKDATTDTRVKVADGSTIGTTDNAQAVSDPNSQTILTTIDEDTGAIKTSVELLDDAVGTHDSAVPTKVIMQGQYAETTVPTAVADGDAVREWHNEYGQKVIFGANLSSNAIDSNIVNPPELNRIDTLTLLDEVTATGASTATDLTNYNKVKLQIVKTGTATVDIQESLDDTTYDDVQSDVDGIVTISGETLKYVKVNVSAYTSGNVTVKMIAGR